MAHHEDSHGHENDHDSTEGNRQYYPQGWYIPLVGLFVVAFFVALGAGALLGISGTDKWGKGTAEGHGHGTHQTDDHHGAGGHDHGDKHDAAAKGDAENNKKQDSTAQEIAADQDTAKTDSAPKAGHDSHEGHAH